MRYFGFITLLYLITFQISCKNEPPSPEISTPKNALLAKAINGAGGLENWKNLGQIQFYKTTKLYLEDGSLQDSTYQLHTYQMYPEMNGEYSYEKNGEQIKIQYNNEIMTKYVNNEKIELSPEESEKLRSGFLGAQFVMCLPYKLNDPGVTLSEEEGVLGEKKAQILKASYSTEHENHTKTHDWWHYIDPNSGKLLGYKVHHAPTYAQVVNEETTEIKGVTFPTYRKTYRVTKDDKRQYVRGEFWYEYYEN